MSATIGIIPATVLMTLLVVVDFMCWNHTTFYRLIFLWFGTSAMNFSSFSCNLSSNDLIAFSAREREGIFSAMNLTFPFLSILAKTHQWLGVRLIDKLERSAARSNPSAKKTLVSTFWFLFLVDIAISFFASSPNLFVSNSLKQFIIELLTCCLLFCYLYPPTVYY